MRTPFFILALGAAFLFATPSADAAKTKKERRAAGGERLLSRFDRDHNGSLDSKESERVQKAFAVLKKLDTDNDGKLSDSEIGAAKIEKREPRKRKQ